MEVHLWPLQNGWIKCEEKRTSISFSLLIRSRGSSTSVGPPGGGGGQFERLIGLVKAALHKTIGHGMLSWGELEEVLLDVETTLNNHPLGFMEDDVQLPTLPPNSMLFLKPDAVELPEKDPNNTGERGLRRRVCYLNKWKDKVWNGWYNEYLKSLRERHCIVHDTAPLELKVGDVVIVCLEERNRGRWPLGIFTELIRSRDGIVRATKLRSGTVYSEMAVQHLYPLELSCDRTTVQFRGIAQQTET